MSILANALAALLCQRWGSLSEREELTLIRTTPSSHAVIVDVHSDDPEDLQDQEMPLASSKKIKVCSVEFDIEVTFVINKNRQLTWLHINSLVH